MIPAELSALIRAVVVEVFADNDLDAALVPESVAVQRPKAAEHGDYASNVALQLAKRAGRGPRELAELIAKRLTERPGIGHVDVAGPGFLNVTLESAAIGELAGTVVAAGDGYGRTSALTGQTINLEFVSANPTGPVHLGHSRWAAVGDSLHRILEAAGADVTAEHYINDAGTQLDHFARSLYARATGRPVPEDGYVGEYVAEVADRVVAAVPGILDQPEEAATAAFREHGYRLMLEEIAASLRRFRVEFDVWFSEQALHESGAVDRAVERLREQGHVYEADGAVWLRTTDFGDDKDRVLVRGNGQYTYLAPDAAYYLDKRARGFDKCIYLLGADHHGYIGRLRTIVAAAGDDPGKHLEVQIGQLVHLVRGGEPLRLSKRAGTIATLDELVELVGVDAARYSLARSSTDSTLTLDVDEITKRTAENPVFYVQYAHARLASLRRNAAEYGLELGDGADWALLSSRWETDLLRALGDFPGVVATAAELRAPHRVARYLEELAGIYHRFYDNCRILPRGDEELTEHALPRLWLSEATRIVLRNGLDLLGVSAPERM
ncbi:MAG: arginine--tRNA ligase [Mycobacteriales bacterium]